MIHLTVREAKAYGSPSLVFYAMLRERYLAGQTRIVPADFGLTLHQLQLRLRAIRDAGHATFLPVRGQPGTYDVVFPADAQLDAACLDAARALQRVATAFANQQALHDAPR